MSWWGKVVGGAFGYMLGGPLGAVLGGAIGHSFDKGLAKSRDHGAYGAAEVERIQTAFFTATFSVLGHVAKADGRVSEDEIELAEAVMAHMQLNSAQRKTAIGLFAEGKAADFPLDELLAQFRRECRRRQTLLRMFLEIQMQGAYADGLMHPAEERVLRHVAERLGFSPLEFEHLEAMVRAARDFGAGARPHKPARDLLAEAYEVLGVPAGSSEQEVRRAYKRLMNQHHPDKLVARGMPEEMVALATEKTQEIKAAYDRIRQARGA